MSPARSPAYKLLALSLASVVCFVGVAEAVLRLARFRYEPRERQLKVPVVSGFVGTFEFYLPTRSAPPGCLWVSEPNTSFTDSRGFRRPEIPERKQPGKVRVAFLGGSTTQGGYRPYAERAIGILNGALGTNRYEALNAACSSYTTHQSLMAFRRWALPLEPDLVLVYHGWNDAHTDDDGYSDRDKDILVQMGPARGDGPVARFLRRLRLTMLVGKLMDLADFSWPRLRVSPDQFRENLAQIATACRNRNIPVIIMIKPESRKTPQSPPEDLEIMHYSRVLHTRDPARIRQGAQEIYSRIQREVAAEFDNARACDAYGLLRDLEEQEARGDFGPDIHVFRGDAVHLWEFAEQKLAELVALTLAPEHEAAIRRYLASYDYHRRVAEEFLTDDTPFEAVYYARKAEALAPGPEPALSNLIAQAESSFEFMRLFREARWGGTETDNYARITKLEQCLQLRPGDLGLCVQVVRTCDYTGRFGDAARILTRFKPASARDAQYFRSEILPYIEAHNMVDTLCRQRRYSDAVAAIRQLMTNQSFMGSGIQEVQVYNNLAWLLATAPDAGVRDGPEALRLAKRACSLMEPNAPTLDTLAAAYAENGDYEMAVKTMEKALRLVDPHAEEDCRRRLALYESRQPYRMD